MWEIDGRFLEGCFGCALTFLNAGVGLVRAL